MTAVTPERIQRVLAVIDRSIGNIPSAGDGGRAAETPRPTERLAVREVDGTGDTAVRAREDIAALEATIVTRAAQGLPTDREVWLLDDLLSRWEPPTGARRDNLAVSAEGKGDDGCRSCARMRDHLGRPRWTLAVAEGLCRSCRHYRDRVRALDGFEDVEVPPMPVMLWLDRHAGRQLGEAQLVRVVEGR